MTQSIAIIGAGISGLTSAYYLKKNFPEYDVTIYEASVHTGGKIHTVRRNGFTIELGPESYLGRKHIMTDIAKELGMEDEIVTNETGQAYIYANNELYKIPGGSILGIPTDWKPFYQSKLISRKGKMRAGRELFIRPLAMDKDMSVGTFFRKRLGDEVLENLVEPLMGGIYGANIDELSLMSTFPNFKEQEERYGSLIKGMRQVKKEREKNKEEGAPKGQFNQFKNGLGSFIDKLVEYLRKEGVNFMFGTKVEKLNHTEEGVDLTLNNGDVQSFEGTIITTPHQAFIDWFKDDPKMDYFKTMPSTSVATVVLAFDEKDIENTYDGTGFVIARSSNTNITACTWTSKKWPHTTPEGKVLVRAYVGKPGETIIEDSSKAELVELVLEDLSKMMNIKGRPVLELVTKMPNSMPQYLVGHRDEIKAIKHHVKETYPNIEMTGASFEAVGLPDCISQASQAVQSLMMTLKTK
ncbi:protoporphyrinogen oxidase [Staphylococcus massiliensis]|uniref:protoporphyrinogen oxidase n=1 Tax=Staphylococcus massiliensis TaxID=555791 RepID=UPI001EE08008|nr:protoporphyrinogen oxidase [Staphylococcus massiliensis]MCG3399668.1 protoporphyrinogen oxidase [Staphylococcus massiliensis]MCG3400772.1 protoporphyrinogen oxidase [Staphylococcus massiliensis]MCG3412063.1 protoporphyrinogen oxidase [Staphylococcus massiliensis]